MLKDPFWITAKDLLRYKKTLALAAVGALLYTGGMGAGLSLVAPLVKLFLDGASPAAQYETLDATVNQRLQHLVDAEAISPETQAELSQKLETVHPELVQDNNPLRGMLRNKAETLDLPTQGLTDWGQAQLNAVADIVPDDPWLTLATILSFMSLVSLVANLGRYMHQYMTITVTNHLALDYRNRIMARMLAMPLIGKKNSSQEAADSATRVIVDSQQLARGHEAILGKVVIEGLKGTIAFCIALVISWKLTFIFLIAAVIIGVALNRIGKRIRKASRRSLEQQGHLLKQMTAVMQSLSVVKSFNALGFERRRFKQLNRVLYQQQMKMRKARAWTSPITEFVGYVGISAAGLLATYWVFHADMPKETVIGVLVGLGVAASSIKPISGLHNQIKEADASAGRILEALSIESEPIHLKDRLGLPKLSAHGDSIAFQNVTYHYPNQPEEPALKNINLDVQHGQTVAIVGTNGAGKSTLLSMLPRLILPTGGQVLIDGQDIQGLNLRSLRNTIGVVTQQPTVFEGTIQDNIAYGHASVTDEQIRQAAQIACAENFIQELPGGYQYALTEGGQGLSGGQKQRICIARAILKDPSILILDEATSQIDAESEAHITKAMQQIRQGRTTFVIAHRLSTVVDSDLIVVMDQGQIIDQGTHQELLTRCGLYQSLTQHQLVSQ